MFWLENAVRLEPRAIELPDAYAVALPVISPTVAQRMSVTDAAAAQRQNSLNGLALNFGIAHTVVLNAPMPKPRLNALRPHCLHFRDFSRGCTGAYVH